MKKLFIIILPFILFACKSGPSATYYFNEGNKGLTRKIPYHDALRAYNKAIELKPDYTLAYAGRGQLEIKMHNFYGAINDLQHALSIDKKIKGIYYFIGYAKTQVGDQDGAREAYTKEIEQNPQNSLAYINRAYTREILNDENGAMEDFNQVIVTKPDSFADVYTGRGLLKIKMNDKTGGCIDLHHSLKLRPDSITLHYIDLNCR
jgi:tetratricopeptide (TPR) repeat protein